MGGMFRDVLVLAAAYGLGCVASGYYLVRWRSGGDVRQEGSGSAGATNVGRQLGRSGFLLTLLMDALKGALAVGMAGWSGSGEAMRWAALGAAMAGHIWPVQLEFRGGKGVATLLGGLLALDPLLLLALGAVFTVIWVPWRRFVPAGLAATIALPLVAGWVAASWKPAAAAAALVLLILVAHRENLRREMATRFARRRQTAGLGSGAPGPG
jgi:acyl phosphate:glycerol-3-phosphate acyltransferase